MKNLAESSCLANFTMYYEILYRWKRGKWSVCSGGCGEGMQSRLVQCQKFVEDGRNSVVLTDEGACGLERKPAEERPCNVTHCNYNWTISNWSSVRFPYLGGWWSH